MQFALLDIICAYGMQKEIVEAMAVSAVLSVGLNVVVIMTVCKLNVIKPCISFSYLGINTPIL